MKQIVSNYSYSPATNVVTLTGVNIDADQLLLIVAPQVGRTLYNFASVTGTVSAGADTRVTLNASTAGLTTTSPLVIFYEDQASTQTVAGTVTASVTNSVTIGAILSPIGQNILQNSGIGAVLKVRDNAGTYGELQGSGTLVYNLPVYGTITVGNSVTISSLPAISGTVTVGGFSSVSVGSGALLIGGLRGGSVVGLPLDSASGNVSVQLRQTATTTNEPISQSNPLWVTQQGSVTIGSVPNGSLTTRFGTPTTANTAFATSAVTNGNRKYLLIQNVTTGSNVITVGIGFTPTTTQGIQLTAGAGITFESSYIPTGQIFVLSSVTASNFTILEA